ncbi:class I adenylate-forming enzyme family protein [Nocardioides nitrophenolicus]|uniref:class I adenylate-forming enzyme family protein n=1 Tax=Nocardioides nitrophenolicus TaxID=60489 RepID=UPI001956DCD5|nr:AMP-binding protein [Nocardioides nitrophenolicus]MBM7516459.1 long-chain acyl-CoA synthetase [Nocardioides nitrophenolicus]
MAGYRLADQARPTGERADHPAVLYAGRTLSFRDVDGRADRFAAGLRRAGVGDGDRVGLLLPNVPEYLEALIGTARAGAVAVPLNWRLAPSELAGVVADAGIRHFLVSPATTALHDALAVDGEPCLVLHLGDDYETWLAAQPAHAEPGWVRAPGRTVLQVYTSGTSGAPKGVLLTDANLGAKVPAVTPWWGVRADSRTLLATPLFHVGGLSWALVGLHAGATTVLTTDTTAGTLIEHLVADRITHTFLVPAMIQRLCAAATDGLSFGHLEGVMFGASPIAAETQQAAYRLFGPVLRQLYGLSETTGAFTEMPAQHDLDPSAPRWRSAGRAYPWVELEIRDPESGRRRAPGEFGEVWTRSAQNTLGYHGRPAETAELLTGDGWLRTGDGGHLDEDGYLFLTDRIKDLIITGGENVYPAEVEQVLRRHPEVADVSVVGVPDPTWGEGVGAAVVLRPGSGLAPDELVAWAAAHLAGYKRPRLVRVLAELPRNATGKVLRRQVREQLAPTPALTTTRSQEAR